MLLKLALKQNMCLFKQIKNSFASNQHFYEEMCVII